MPKPLSRLHIMQSKEAKRSQTLLRQARETYVPSRLRRILREEGRIMMDFDAATTAEARLKELDGLIRARRLVMDMIGWPKPPTIKGGRLPAGLDALRNHNPLGDVDVESSTVLPEPLDPPPGA